MLKILIYICLPKVFVCFLNIAPCVYSRALLAQSRLNSFLNLMGTPLKLVYVKAVNLNLCISCTGINYSFILNKYFLCCRGFLQKTSCHRWGNMFIGEFECACIVQCIKTEINCKTFLITQSEILHVNVFYLD